MASNPAIDAFVGVDHQHVFAFIEAVHRADLDAVHELAFDAGFGDDIGHARRLQAAKTGLCLRRVGLGGKQIEAAALLRMALNYSTIS